MYFINKQLKWENKSAGSQPCTIMAQAVLVYMVTSSIRLEWPDYQKSTAMFHNVQKTDFDKIRKN